MDLSMKKYKNENDCSMDLSNRRSSNSNSILHEPNPAAVFLPYEFPLDCRVSTGNIYSHEFCKEIALLEKRSEETKLLLERVMPIMAYYREKYSKMNTQQQQQQQQQQLQQPVIMPPNALNENSKKRKRSIDDDSSSTCTSESETLQSRAERINKEIESKYPKLINANIVQIGSRGTAITREQFDSVFWFSAPAAVRYLLSLIFDIETLATHTLTGKPSPAFVGRERPAKNRLDENKVADITECVMAVCKGTSLREIRSTITTKCAEASKKKRYSAAKSQPEIADIVQPTSFSNHY